MKSDAIAAEAFVGVGDKLDGADADISSLAFAASTAASVTACASSPATPRGRFFDHLLRRRCSEQSRSNRCTTLPCVRRTPALDMARLLHEPFPE